MAAITAAIGLGLAAVGAATSIYSATQQQEANKQAIAAQQQGEAVRKQAMQIDADRRRRQFIREGIIARSTALARTTAQGANQSSALSGSFGQIAGRTSWGVSGVNIGENLGTGIFNANEALLEARLAQGQAQTIGGIGASLSSLGGAMVSNYGTINKIFGGDQRGINYGIPGVSSTGQIGIQGVAPFAPYQA